MRVSLISVDGGWTYRNVSQMRLGPHLAVLRDGYQLIGRAEYELNRIVRLGEGEFIEVRFHRPQLDWGNRLHVIVLDDEHGFGHAEPTGISARFHMRTDEFTRAAEIAVENAQRMAAALNATASALSSSTSTLTPPTPPSPPLVLPERRIVLGESHHD